MVRDAVIFAARVDFAMDAAAFTERYYRLPEIRRAKVDFYVYPRDKAVALAAGLLMCWCLEQTLGRPLAEGELSVDARGKPFLQGQTGIHFNISHAGAYVVCVVADRETGVDIEEIRDNDYREVARLAFSREDYAVWEAQPAGEKVDGFFRLWTLRESFTKAMGLGSSLAAGDVAFSQVKGRPDTYKAHYRGADRRQEWYCRQYGRFPGYKLALCLPQQFFPAQVRMVTMQDLCNT
ncbi:MAG: 4'-phosphopantetheinyl transferase superfamily protein [Bacillota bacterium]